MVMNPEDENLKDGVADDGSGAPTGGSEDGSVAPQTDWEALLEEERNKTEQWKTAALKAKRQLKEHKPDPANPDEPVTETEEEKITRIATEVAHKAVSIKTEDSILAEKVKDPKQRALVKHYLENRIVRTGTSEEALTSDIEFAIAAANSKKNAIRASELERAIVNDSRGAPSSGPSADRGVERKTHQWTPDQEKELEKRARQLKIDPEKFKADAWKNRSRTNVATS